MSEFFHKLLHMPVLAAEKNGAPVDNLIIYIHWLMIALFIGWFSYFVYCLWRFNAKRNPKADHAGTKSHISTYIEYAVIVHGFMWFGTKDGLSRYDGRDFYVFRNRVNDSTSLCSNNITCLAYDNDSILWIGTSSSGFCAYDFRTQKFKTYNNQNLPLYSNIVNAITYDSSRNALWVGINGGLYLFILQTRTIILRNPESLRNVYDVHLRDSIVFIGSLLQSLRKPGDPFYRNTLGPALTLNIIWEGSDGRLWCGSWDNALHEFNEDAKLLDSYIFDGSGKLNFSSERDYQYC